MKVDEARVTNAASLNAENPAGRRRAQLPHAERVGRRALKQPCSWRSAGGGTAVEPARSLTDTTIEPAAHGESKS